MAAPDRAAATKPENAAIYELERRLEQEQRNIDTWQRSLIEAIDKEKQAHEAVERMKENLNGSVAAHHQIEDALRRLRGFGGEPEPWCFGSGRKP